MDYIVSRYEEETGENLYDDLDTISELYVDVETWKKTLSTREKVTMTVNGPGGRFREELTREKYNELTHALLNRTRNLLDDILREAAKRGYPLEKIDKLLLVGGSSRMSQVAAMLEEVYGKKASRFLTEYFIPVHDNFNISDRYLKGVFKEVKGAAERERVRNGIIGKLKDFVNLPDGIHAKHIKAYWPMFVLYFF